MRKQSGILTDELSEAIAVRYVSHRVCREIALRLTESVQKARRTNRPEYFTLRDAFLIRYHKSVVKVMRSHWERERRIVISNIKRQAKFMTTKASVDDMLFPKDKMTAELIESLTPEMTRLMNEYVAVLIEVNDFDIPPPTVMRIAVKWLKKYIPKLSKNLETVSIDKLRRALIEGMEAGEGVGPLSKRVNEIFKTWDKNRAVNIARSETIRASNKAALMTYREAGIKKKIWITWIDDRTCPYCEYLDNRVISIERNYYDLGDTASVVVDGVKREMEIDYTEIDAPPLHAMCVLPGTRCESPSDIISGLRTLYRGQAIQLTFSDGSELSVTPNHMLLTPNGFASAQLLREGDDVFYCADFKRPAFSGPNNNNGPSSIEDIVGSLTKTSGMRITSVPVSPEYLHGDARFADGNIDVIHSNGLLRDTGNVQQAQRVGEEFFTSTDSDFVDFSGFGGLDFVFKSLAFASDCGMSGERQSHPFFFRRAAHSGKHGVTPISGLDSYLKKMPPNDRSGNIEPLGKRFFGLPEFIKTKKVVRIKVDFFHGYVYDLHTTSTLYISEGIISSNCRCTVAAVIE